MKKNNNLNHTNLILNVICVVLVLFFSVALYYTLQVKSSAQYRFYYGKYKVGEISDVNLVLKQSLDIIDEETTKELRNTNAKKVYPVFSYSYEIYSQIVDKIELYKSAVAQKNQNIMINVSGEALHKLIADSVSEKDVSAAYEITKTILSKGFYDKNEVATYTDGYNFLEVHNNIKSSTASGAALLPVKEVITEENFSVVVDSLVMQLSKDIFTMEDKYVVKSIVEYFCQPNVKYDAILTQNMRYYAYNNTQPIVLSLDKGLMLLEADKVVTQRQIQLLQMLGNRTSVTLYEIASILIRNFVCICILYYTLYIFLRHEKLHQKQFLIVITVSEILCCVFAFFAEIYAIDKNVAFTEAFLPMCFTPILATMITGRRRIGFSASFLCGLVLSSIPGSNIITFFYCTLNGLFCCCVVRFFNKRLDSIKQWLFSIVITSFLTLIFMFVDYAMDGSWYVPLIANVVNITLSIVVLAVLVPLLERIFNLPTVFRLYELAYGESPLLTKLAQSAPGTYSHSHAVALLAENACKDINANALLARVGGLYHDIGKAEHPEYFVENQSGDNKHNDMNPSLSVSVIKNHVRVGADMAREAYLPAEVVDIVANHHGNDVIQYFYNEAKKQSEDQNVSSIDYSYNNSDIPHTRECGIVMLADSIEAAARTVSEPTIAKFSKLIKSITLGKINRGQLDKCDISMKEIDTVCDSFLKTLTAQYHSRIEYPDEDEKQ